MIDDGQVDAYLIRAGERQRAVAPDAALTRRALNDLRGRVNATVSGADELLAAAEGPVEQRQVEDRDAYSRRWLSAAAAAIVVVAGIAAAVLFGRGEGALTTVPPATSIESDVLIDMPRPDWAVSIDMVDAQVLGRNPDNIDVRIEIDRGSVHGVMVGMPVINSGGLVGSVTTVHQDTSVVTLLTSTDLSVGAKTVSTGTVPEITASGVVSGRGADTSLRFDSPSGTVPSVGDALFTVGGSDSLQPPDIPIGRIVNVTGEGAADVQPTADLSRLDRVQVLLYRPATSTPTASATPTPGRAPDQPGITISAEQRAAWDNEGERLIRSKQEAFENGPYPADDQALGFAAQSDPIDISEPGQYELRFHLDDTARLPDGEFVDGFAINAPPWLSIRYDIGNINIDDDGTMVITLSIPDQEAFKPFDAVTFWIY